MAKQRPNLGTFASPTSQLITPIQSQATPLNEQAIRDAYDFANSFSELSTAMGNLYVTLKQEQNAEQVQAGKQLVDSNRKTYADLVKSGEINPSENPWMAIGAQQASGVLEASKSRAEFQQEYDRRIAENPELLKDNQFFDALAASYAQNKQAEFGTAQYLSNSFFDSFNPYVAAMGMKHSEKITEYRQGKIVQSLRVKVDEALQELLADPGFGKRKDGSSKDFGWEGVMYDLEGRPVSEKSVTLQFDDLGEVEIPLLVPGLSTATKEKIVYENATLDDLSIEDQKFIIDHALKEMNQGRTPFFDTEDKINRLLPEIQTFMDEMGANMGMPRTANLATAAHLIEAMKSGPTTYVAEELLNRLQGGTGLIKDTEEVKVMLSSASEDISKVRFTLLNQQEKTAAALVIEEAYKQSFISGGDLGYESYVDKLMAQLDSSTTLSVEDRGRILDQFNERWNNAGREGRESADRQQIREIGRLFSTNLSEFGAKAGSAVANWQGLRLMLGNHMRTFDIDPSSPQAKNVEEQMRLLINDQLATNRANLLQNLRNNAAAYGVVSTDTALDTLNPVEGEPLALRVEKERYRIALKTNEIMAAVHFGMEDRLESVRSIAISGISLDVEKGIRPELSDLIYAYRNAESGRIPISKLVGSGPAAERMQKFLEKVSFSMSSNMDIDDAVRDAAQQTNMLTPMNASDLVNFKIGSTEMEGIRSTLDSLSNYYIDSWAPFGIGDRPMNSDSITSMNSMFMRKYMESLNRTSGSHETAVREAEAQVIANSWYIRGSVVPKEEFVAANISDEYLANFIDMEAGPSITDATLVVVGYGGNAQPVFALRTQDGSSINNRYYTVEDIADNSKPRNELGEIIPGSLSMRERVIQRMGSNTATKRRTVNEMRLQGFREMQGKSKL